jgi:hypothetical protein
MGKHFGWHGRPPNRMVSVPCCAGGVNGGLTPSPSTPQRPPYIRPNRETLDRPGGGHQGTRSMSLLTISIDSTHLTRWNFGLGALTLSGVFAIGLALILP